MNRRFTVEYSLDGELKEETFADTQDDPTDTVEIKLGVFLIQLSASGGELISIRELVEDEADVLL